MEKKIPPERREQEVVAVGEEQARNKDTSRAQIRPSEPEEEEVEEGDGVNSRKRRKRRGAEEEVEEEEGAVSKERRKEAKGPSTD